MQNKALTSVAKTGSAKKYSPLIVCTILVVINIMYAVVVFVFVCLCVGRRMQNGKLYRDAVFVVVVIRPL